MSIAVEWERNDYSRIPFRLYHDPEIYRLEQERIFRGPTWSYLCLEIELPEPGSFITTWIGETPVLVSRAKDGAIHAVVNRCAHRGATVRRERRGKADDMAHTCIYHRWCYGLGGELIGIPFQRGVKGLGGMEPGFNKRDHGLQKLTVETRSGVVFGTFSASTEPLSDFLGPMILQHLDRLMQRPLKLLGYQRQKCFANWKSYNENLRDTYHASLLHEFLVTFGLDRATQKGGVEMDDRHRHNLTYAHAGTDSDAEVKEIYREQRIRGDHIQLRDTSILGYRKEYDDTRTMATSSVFPNVAFAQLNNTLATRQIQPKGVDQFVLVWTWFGYADDDEALTLHRLQQHNLLGPGGFVSMEDAEALEITHRATKSSPNGSEVVEMGGRGEISNRDYRVTDVPVRGFWSYYAELMGIEPEGAVR